MSWRRRNYPGRFDQSTWESRQSDVPSQEMAVGTPYSNEYQVDIASIGQDSADEAFIGDGTIGSQPGGTGPGAGPGGPGGGNGNGNSFVRHTFDSRPVLARDATSPVYPDQFGHSNDPQGTFTVPAGYIGIVREAWYEPNLIGATMDDAGKPAGTFSGAIRVNGIGVPGFNFFDLSPFYPGGGSIECFILLNAGDQIQGFAFFNGTDITGTLGTQSGWHFYVNLLINDGRDLPQYAGNRDCEPVCLDAGTIAQIKPPPLVIPSDTAPGGAIIVSKPICTRPPAVSVNEYMACIIAGGVAAPA